MVLVAHIYCIIHFRGSGFDGRSVGWKLLMF